MTKKHVSFERRTCFQALTVICGPMPAGSPIVKASGCLNASGRVNTSGSANGNIALARNNRCIAAKVTQMPL